MLTAIAVIVSCFTIVLFISVVHDSGRSKKLEVQMTQLRSMLTTNILKTEKSVEGLTLDRDRRDKKTEDTFQAVRKELEIMITRQRSLEKKILSGDRTVNLVINGTLPVTDTKQNQKPVGRGKSALIPEQ